MHGNGRPTVATTATGIRQDRSVACNGKDDNVSAVRQSARRIPTGPRVYRIAVLGGSGVGKSAIIIQFISHRFLDNHSPTLEDSYRTQVVIDREAALMDILDTGQGEYTAMRVQYIRWGEGFIICYSVTDRHSFQETMEIGKLISRVRGNENIPLVLVGNKFDLQEHREVYRILPTRYIRNYIVTTDEGKALAEEFECPFYETSAAVRRFIDDPFFSLVRQIRTKERPGYSHRKRSRWSRIRSLFAFIFRRRRHASDRAPN